MNELDRVMNDQNALLLCALLSLGIVLIAWVFALIRPRIPEGGATYCPFCKQHVIYKTKWKTDTIASMILSLVFPLPGLIYILIQRSKYKCYCSVCKHSLGNDTTIVGAYA